MRRVHVRYFVGAVLVVAACGIALWISAGRRAGVSSTTAPPAPAVPAEDQQAAAPEADIAEGPAFEPAEVDDVLDDDILALDPLEDLDLLAEIDKQQRERLEKAKAALIEQLELHRGDGSETIRLLEEFFEEFPLSQDTFYLALTLADRYGSAGRPEDARALYGRLMTEMPEGFAGVKQTAAFELAEMEARLGNLDAAEKVLKDIMDSPVPDFMADMEFMAQSFEVRTTIDAPLELATIYGRQGRFAEARALLDEAIAYALSMPPDHTDFGNLPYHVVRVYSGRAVILLDEAGEVELDDAMGAALRLIDSYAREFEGVSLSEHSRNCVADYQDHLRIIIANRAWNRKIDFLFSRTAAGDLDAALDEARVLIGQYRTTCDGHQWHSQAAADEFQQNAGWMEKRVARLAEEKRTGE